MKYFIQLLITILLILPLNACAAKEKTTLRVLFAGSLIVPAADIEKAFEEAHPDIDLLMEGHGSIQCVRIVTDLNEPADVIITADYSLLPDLMYTATNPTSGIPYADWNVAFASNRLSLAYTADSAYADEINAENWPEILARPDVRVGLADPRFDSAGYRTLMALQLAELDFDDTLIFENITMGRFQSPIRTFLEDELWVIQVPEILETKSNSDIVMRGGSIQLIALLENGEIDYAFEYDSVSQQHGFLTVPLADTVHLGYDQYADDYAAVEVRLDFQRFERVNPVFRGEPIRYGLTIPSNAAHADESLAFVTFLLGAEGQAILEQHNHPTIAQPILDQPNNIPPALLDTLSTAGD